MRTNHRIWIGLGYAIIFILNCIIGYIWYCEWNEIEKLEFQNQQIDEFRKEISNIYIQFVEFSLSGETVLEWDDEELEHCHTRRMVMDSMLCRFKSNHTIFRLDSQYDVRYLCAVTFKNNDYGKRKSKLSGGI